MDDRTQERVIESLVPARGSVGARAEGPRAVLRAGARGSGSIPASNPLAFLRLNGKEFLPDARCDRSTRAYPTREPRIIDGPKVIDLAGTKLVYAVCRASTPMAAWRPQSPRCRWSIRSTCVLMKAETKSQAPRDAVDPGPGCPDEMEAETIPASAQEPGGGVDLP